MAKDKVRPTLTVEAAREMVRRRIGVWKKVNVAREKLAAREKGLRADIKSCLKAMKTQGFEAAGVKAQIVKSRPIVTGDTGNIALLEKVLTAEEFDSLCPRAIKAKRLQDEKPELAEQMAKGVKSTLRLDYIQEPAPGRKTA